MEKMYPKEIGKIIETSEEKLECGVDLTTELHRLTSEDLSKAWLEVVRKLSPLRRQELENGIKPQGFLEILYRNLLHEARERGYLITDNPFYNMR